MAMEIDTVSQRFSVNGHSERGVPGSATRTNKIESKVHQPIIGGELGYEEGNEYIDSGEQDEGNACQSYDGVDVEQERLRECVQTEFKDNKRKHNRTHKEGGKVHGGGSKGGTNEGRGEIPGEANLSENRYFQFEENHNNES